MNPKYPTTVEELPDKEFFAILYPESVTSTETWGPPDPPDQIVRRDYWRMEVFPNRAAWEEEIRKLSAPGQVYPTKFKAVIMRPAKVTTNISVAIDPLP